MVDQRISGRIIKVSKQGWGFISSKEIEFTRIFFHWSSLRQNTLRFPEIRSGMIVEFTPIQVPGKGWRAIHVEITDKREKKDEPTTEMSTLSSGLPDAGTSNN